MNEVNEEIEYQISRVLGVCVEWLGLQRSAANILAALYVLKNSSGKSLSMDELCKVSNLSHSTVSSICSQLESLDLVERQLDGTPNARGRRRLVFSLRVGIDGLLKVGCKRNINNVLRILGDIRLMIDKTQDEDIESEINIQKITEEICYFLENPWQNEDSEVCV